MRQFETIGTAVDAAVKALRQQVGDVTAPIAIITPMHLNNAFARRAIAEAGPQIRLYYYTPESLVRDLSARRLAAQRLEPESAVRHAALVADAIDTCVEQRLLGGYEETLSISSWKQIMATTLRRIESAGLRSVDLVPTSERWIDRRYTLLHNVLRRVEAARQRLGIAGPLEVREAAVAGVEDPSTWCNQIQGVVLLGDRDLSHAVFEPVRQWLERRPAIRIAVAPVDNVALSPALSLRVLGRPTAEYTVASMRAVGHLQRNLWKTSAPHDHSGVSLVRTPDEVRENDEVVRFIQAQVVAGTALDQIAVVLPDDNFREPLAAAFERAGIPATWFVTGTVAAHQSSRFLLLALDIAGGKQGLDVWYDVLRQWNLMLPRQLGVAPVGSGRWRRLLSRCGGHEGADVICASLASARAELSDPDDVAASESLEGALSTFAAATAGLLRFDDLAQFATNCRRFLTSWWRHSAERARTLDVLRSLEAAGRDLSATPENAVEQLRHALEAATSPDGYLSDAAVRVLPPMACVGADFEVVCVLGLAQGRFPRKQTPDPILNEAMLADLADRHPYSEIRRSRELVEQRRFAAALSAARRELWLSVPAFEGLAERPSVASVFALDVLSALNGERATFSELNATMSTRGSIATPYASDPNDALGTHEHVVSGIMANREEFTAQLVSHRFARNLLALHLDLASPAPLPAAVVAPHRLPALDGASMKPWQLAELLSSPGKYFMRYVLGAWRAQPLLGSFRPLSQHWLNTQLAVAVHRALTMDTEFRAALAVAWLDAVDDAVGHHAVDPMVHDTILELGRRKALVLTAIAGDEFGARLELETPQPVAAEQPWLLDIGSVRIADNTLIEVTTRPQTVATALQIHALTSAGQVLDGAVIYEPSAAPTKLDAKKLPKEVERLAQIASLADRGQWPWGGSSAWTLSADRTALTPDLLEAILGGAP